MTAVAPKPIATRPYPAHVSVKGSYLLRMFRTTDPKMLGIMYLTTSFGFFLGPFVYYGHELAWERFGRPDTAPGRRGSGRPPVIIDVEPVQSPA